MKLKITIPASDILVSLADAKAYLRVDGTAEDKLINRMIANATNAIETIIDRTILTATMAGSFVAEFAGTYEVLLMDSPIQDVTATITLGNYTHNALCTFLHDRIVVKDVPLSGTVTITARVGYGDDADSVPGAFNQAVLNLVAYWYQNREAGDIPASVRSMIAGYRRITV